MEQHPGSGSHNQEPLIDAHPQSGDMVVRDFNLPESYVDLEQTRIHHLNILSLFSAINQRERLMKYQTTVAVERYGEKAPYVLEAVAQNLKRLELEAEDRFMTSVGLPMVEATAAKYPESNLDETRRMARLKWTQFQGAYRGEDRRHRRNARKQELLSGWVADDILRAQTEFNRQHDLRPYISEKDQKRALEQGKVYPLLDTQDRLLAISDDPRAGFLPTTNREKSRAFTHLDYLDNPEYPLGITNQLFEVLIRQQHLDKPRAGDTVEQRAAKRQRAQERSGLHMGIRSLESIAYEMGDFYHNARETLSALEGLCDFLNEGILPALPIGEEVPIANLGLRALVRYRDLAHYRDTGKTPQGIKDPLLTREDRIRKEADRSPTDTGSNKTVEDLYTRGMMEDNMVAYIAEQANTMTIKQARQLIGEAVDDQRARAMYYYRQLTSVSVMAPDADILTLRSITGQLVGRTAA